jgi:DNA-binding FadR family transcriptional regulator
LKDSKSIFETIREDKASSLAEQVAERINQLIVERDLQPGMKLPNEFELGECLNVGRGTVREAVKLLVSRNILEIQRGKGTYVAQKTGQIEDPLGLAYLPSQVRLARELLEIRMQMEPWIAEQAARHATEPELERLDELRQQVEALIRKDENHLAVDKEFHTCIAECAHNRVLPKLIPIITYSVDLFGLFYQGSDETPAGSKEYTQAKTIETHQKIVDAIRKHDPDYARKAMIEHLMGNRAQIEALEQSGLDE